MARQLRIEFNGAFYHNDHLVTPQKMTDSSATVVWYGEFLPFGEPLSITGTITNNLRFPGQYYDEETGLHYNYFRDYAPMIGRYVESDPIGIKKGRNHLYGYVGNAPLTKRDVMGLYPGPCGNEDHTWVPDYPFGIFDFTGPCQRHDDCYGCEGAKEGKSKYRCDLEFLWDMIKVCSQYAGNPALQSACASAAATYYGAVSGGGGDAFEKGRSGCCGGSSGGGGFGGGPGGLPIGDGFEYGDPGRFIERKS